MILTIETAAIKGADAYIWFTVTKPFTLERRGGNAQIKKGMTVGIRAATSDKTKLRLVVQELGESIVFSLDNKMAELVRKSVVRHGGAPMPATPKAEAAGPFAKLPNFPKFTFDMGMKNVKPFWKWADKNETRFIRIPGNNIAYHGVSEKVALAVLKSGGLRKGTHVTSNPHDAMYWAASNSDGEGCGAVVLKMDLGSMKLNAGDQRDTENHAVLTAQIQAKPVYYLPESEIEDRLNAM